MSRWIAPVLTFVLGLLLGGWALRREATPVAPAPPVKEPAPPVAAVPAAPAVVPAAKPEQPNRPSPAARPDDARWMAELNERQQQVASLERTLGEAHARIETLEQKMLKLGSLGAAADAREKELLEKLETLRQQLAAGESQVRARDGRLAELQQSLDRAQKAAAAAAQQAAPARVTTTLAELEELARRRDAYLNNILGRYREATEMFRTMSLRLDNPRDGGSPLNNDLARIQTAIQSAEEDMRQLRTLNAQSARLQKELSARR